MSNLLEVADLAWSQLFPKGSVQSAVSKEEFIATAKSSFAFQQLQMAWREKADNGYFEVPSYLLTEIEKEVIDNEIDICELKYFKSLPEEVWLANIGGIQCDCRYIKSTVNLSQLLCDDDSLADSDKTYYVVGKKIKFPQGTHKNKLTIIYANSGENIDGSIEIDEALADLVRTRLLEVYGGKVGQVDVTNNNNSNN